MSATKTRIFSFFAYGLVLYLVSFLWVPNMDGNSFWFSLFVVPFCLGMFSQAVFDPTVSQTTRRVTMLSLGLLALLVIGLLVTALEALICVAMALPIIIPADLMGIISARYLLQKMSGETGTNTIKVSLALLPILALPLDYKMVFPQRDNVFRSEITILAPPQTVWAQTLIIPTIQPKERIWSISHNILGTPAPVRAELNGNLRSLSWTKGVQFQEIITEQIKNRRLAWRFNFNDPASLASFDPHVSPNSEMLRVSDGFYELHPLPDGKTQLILETHYQTRSPFNGYLKMWGSLFLGNFHSAVLAVIQNRSESLFDGNSR